MSEDGWPFESHKSTDTHDAQMKMILLEIEGLKKYIDEKTIPKKSRPRAHWRDIEPTIIDMVRTRGYATSKDAETLGLCNTEWQRCISHLVIEEPAWKITTIKHVKYLHRPDFDLDGLRVSLLTLGRCTPTDPKLHRLLVDEISKAGRLNVLAYLQDQAPERSESWQDDVVNALGKFIKENDCGIEREATLRGHPGDWFRRRG